MSGPPALSHLKRKTVEKTPKCRQIARQTSTRRGAAHKGHPGDLSQPRTNLVPIAFALHQRNRMRAPKQTENCRTGVRHGYPVSQCLPMAQ